MPSIPAPKVPKPPNEHRMTLTSIRLPPQLVRRVDEIVVEESVERATMIRNLLEEALTARGR